MTISTIDDVILPKAKILRELVSVVSGLRPQSKELLWGTTTFILSCMGLIIAPKPLRNIVLPVTDDSDENLLDISTACVLNDPAALRTDLSPEHLCCLRLERPCRAEDRQRRGAGRVFRERFAGFAHQGEQRRNGRRMCARSRGSRELTGLDAARQSKVDRPLLPRPGRSCLCPGLRPCPFAGRTPQKRFCYAT